MANCPTCGQNVDNDLVNTLRLLDWDDFIWHGAGHGEWNLILGTDIEVAAIKEAEVDSYGYVNDEDVWVIVKVGDKHFKRSAIESSYGGRSWEFEIKEVKPKTVTKVVFE